MEREPELIESFYFIKLFDPISKKWHKTKWRMTEDEIKSRYAEGQYEILWDTKEDLNLGGDRGRMRSSSFLKKPAL
mgnify:FL=1